MTKRSVPFVDGSRAALPAGSAVREKSRLRRYSDSGAERVRGTVGQAERRDLGGVRSLEAADFRGARTAPDRAGLPPERFFP